MAADAVAAGTAAAVGVADTEAVDTGVVAVDMVVAAADMVAAVMEVAAEDKEAAADTEAVRPGLLKTCR